MELRTNPELRDLAIRNALGLSRQRHRDPVDELAAAAERLEKVASLFGERGGDEPWYSGVLREFARGLAPALAPLVQQIVMAQQAARTNGVVAHGAMNGVASVPTIAQAEQPALPEASAEEGLSLPADPRAVTEAVAMSAPADAAVIVWNALSGTPALAQVRGALASLTADQLPEALLAVRQALPEWGPLVDFVRAQDQTWHEAFLARARELALSATN
jgi:hypothetical protein